jgi:sec-independent protein translocase protein TatB
VFGIGPQEIVIIGLLVLLIFGPSKLPQIARDLGRFANDASRMLEELTSEITSEGEENRTSRGKPRESQEPKQAQEPKEVQEREQHREREQEP